MQSKLSATEFVIRAPVKTSLTELATAIGSLGSVETVAGHAGLFHVRLAHAGDDARHGWAAVRKQLGDAFEVYPVYLDEDDQPRYSVGTMQVRFPAALSDSELADWLPQGLRVKERNEFVPAQIVLEPENAQRDFLPDLVNEVEQHSKQPVRVWPETLQAFRRS